MTQARLRALKIAVSCVVLLTVAGTILGVWYLRQLEKIVSAKFSSRKWDFPSKIYSDGYLLYPGIALRWEDLREKLQRLGYREVPVPKSKGEYRYSPQEQSLHLYLHDFAHPSSPVKGFAARISFQGNTIGKIEDVETQEEVYSLDLEPELVTGLYDRIWEERRLVKLSEVPPFLVQAILSIEDERFYRHWGVDPIAVARAFLVNLGRGGIVQGGSTLTQQLMKNFFLGDERTFRRKVKEALMALVAERKYSKNEILENYLNEIYLGQKGAQGIFGVWEAAQFYFSKELSDLTYGEMAVLAGLIRAPNRYSPYRSVQTAMGRRNVVLGKMLEEGFFPRGQYEKSLKEVIQPRPLVKVANDAPFYVDFVRRELAADYSNEVLVGEGLSIFTGLDLQLQRIAEKALTDGLRRLEADFPHLRQIGQEDTLEGAVVVIKPQTGEIKAIVGGRDYQKSQFNRVFQARRQPGSVFKPFVYLAALMYPAADGRKFKPTSFVEDSPFTWSYEGQEWEPANYKDEYLGLVTFRRALERSLNSATARIAKEVGVKNIREVAYRLGIRSPLPALPSLALGSVEVTMLEVATAFATLANNGVRTEPLAVKQVVDQKGRVLERRDIRVTKVISPETAFMINYLLMGVMDRGTGMGARLQGFDRPAAGKTGTTNDTRDAWFAGYTPDLLAVVWVGFDNQSKLGLSGAQAALPIWTDFMKRALESTPPTPFLPPAGVRFVDIDPQSGQRATSACPQVLREAFFEGEEPTDFCTLHPTATWSEVRPRSEAGPGPG